MGQRACGGVVRCHPGLLGCLRREEGGQLAALAVAEGDEGVKTALLPQLVVQGGQGDVTGLGRELGGGREGEGGDLEGKLGLLQEPLCEGGVGREAQGVAGQGVWATLA